MKRLIIQVFLIALLFYSNQGTAQVFTKVTDSPLVRDSCNSYYSSWADYDNDGDIDLYLPMWFGSPVNPFAKNYLYQNNCNGDFSKVQAISGGLITDPFAGAGSYWVDYNNDGLLDLYVFQSRESNVNNSLYEKQKDGGFIKVNKSITNFNTSIGVFADYNNDGILDVYTGDTSLFVGDGNDDFSRIVPSPIFTDTTHWSRNAVGAWADYDNDNDIDLLVITAINDGTIKNYLFMYNNDGQGGFQIDTLMLPYSDWSAAYGCAWADYDNDLDLDLWVNRNGGYDILLNNDGTGHFTQVTTGPVVNTSAVCQAGAAWADYDNDGDIDLFVPTFYENFLFDNNGDGTFIKNTSETFSNDAGYESYGACWADYNNDGDLDLFVNTGWANANDFLYKNNLYENNSAGHHWLKFECHGVTSNRDAIGTRIYAKAKINGNDVWQMREINANTTRGGESGGANGHVVHMGFGDASVIDSLKIFWPASNTTQVFTNVAVDQFLTIYENASSLQNVAQCVADLPVKNPAIVSGKLYSDENNNCIFDAGDLPLANHFIKASPGAYFVMTDENGDYNLNVPEGNYNITFEPNRNEPWEFRKCNADSSVNLNLTSGTITSAIDFPVFAEEKFPCYRIDVQISSIGIAQDGCPQGQVLSTPCPGYPHVYCFSITNNGQNALPTGSILTVTFDEYMSIIAILSNTCGYSISLQAVGPILTNLNGAVITTTGPLNPGSTCEVCFRVNVLGSATPIYPVTAILTPPGSSGNNLIVNGDFESGNTGFTSNYIYTPVGPTTYGDYNISTNPNSQNTQHLQTDHTTGSGNMLYADGSLNNNEYVWISPTYPVLTFTNYIFSGFFNNIIWPPINSYSDPIIAVNINGNQVVGGVPIPENPDIWINENHSWCSRTNTSAQIKIRSLSTQKYGNDFAIDDLSFIQAAGYDYYEDQESCACDPNGKNVFPLGCGNEGNIPYGTELEFLVRFENIGTGSAHNIIVRDMLDANLDITSFQILASSHPITSIQIIPNNTLIIDFENIELPGIQYEPANKGFIKFKIKPNDGLPEGTKIENRADIYFDQNEVVLTNTTLNTIRTFPQPDAEFEVSRKCQDTKTIDLSYLGLTPDSASFYWEFGPDATPSYSTEMNPQNIIFSDYGTKYITLTVSRFGCISTGSDSIALESVSCGNNKVLVCHNGHTICISENALPAHLAHGDCLGECGISLKNSTSNAVDNEKTVLLNISPNPATDNAKFTLFSSAEQKISIQIYNSFGVYIETIFNGELEENNTKEINYSTQNLSQGMYFIYLVSGTEKQVQRLTIIK